MCRTEIRHRLPFAALQNIDQLSFARLIQGKKVLHFAPEDILVSKFSRMAGLYTTADFLRNDCDIRLDLCNLKQLADGSYDVVIAIDVLEHVPDYCAALSELYRVLSPGGFAIIGLPQIDNLEVTYEDPAIVTREDRAKHFGQWDHLRLFGNDFPRTAESKGFAVTTVDETWFTPEIRDRCVLYPPVLSSNPLATNFRKAFFCQRAATGVGSI
jgi:SAM-dependent methyltransferase